MNCPRCDSELDENGNCLDCGWINPLYKMFNYLDVIYEFGFERFNNLRRQYLQDEGNKELKIGKYANLCLN